MQRIGLFALVCLLLSTAGLAKAGRFNRTLDVGSAAPQFSALPGVDGAAHGLSDFADAKAVVVIFTCNHCPVARSYEDRLIALERKYAEQGVEFVALSVSRYEADRLDKMKERAAEKNFQFPYLYDESQQVGRDFGATATPQVFVLDGERQVAYMGAIDDNAMVPDKVTKHYLRDAIDAVLAGKTPEVNETRPVGCGIIYE